MSPKTKLDPQWDGRRVVIRASLIACLALALLAIFKDDGSGGLAGAVMPSVAFLATGIIGSYCFGAAWERVSGVPGGNSIATESSAHVDEDTGETVKTVKRTEERTVVTAAPDPTKTGGP